LGPGTDEVGQKGLIMTSLTTKKRNPKPKLFFNCRHEDLPTFWGFEHLFSAIVGRDIPTQKYVQTARF